MLKNTIVNIKRHLGLMSFYDYWEYRKQLLINKGLKCGSNVHILNSNIDDEHCPLISIGDNVTITGATILAHDASTKKFIGYSKVGTVSIGSNVFIGYGAIILSGVSIGNNCIIGAGSVVRENIPDDSVVMGNPSRIIGSTSQYIEKNRKRLGEIGKIELTNPEDIEKLIAYGNRGYME